MEIQTKRVYEQASPDDGARVLVDRLWPRGVAKGNLDGVLWLKEIAPSDRLRKWFGHDPARWEEFRERYFAELDAAPDAVERLAGMACQGRVTLLYAARDTQHNQAVALKEYLEACLRSG